MASLSGETNTANFYQGTSLISNAMYESQRIYDRRTALLSYIEEGRAAFMRLLLQYAKAKGAYVATDVETRWGVDYARKPRHYFKSTSQSSADAKNDIFIFDSVNGARIQVNDIYALIGSYVPVNRDVSNLTNSIPSKTKSAATPLPELVRVTAVTQVSGDYQVTVERNFGGTGLPAVGHVDLAVTPSETTFLWRMANSLEENSDDQQIYGDTTDWDWNYCQYVMRKWGAGELEQNVNRFFSGNETTLQRNGRRTLEDFFAELDATALLGVRKKENINGKWKAYAGGLLEFIPQTNVVGVTDLFFQTKNFNEGMKDKFYYGSQTKIALCGANFYTKVSNMLDNKIILPSAQTGWGVELMRYDVTNGGRLLFAPSDTMSMNGLSDYCILYDPATFKYGHLQNMDIKVIDVPNTNPHLKEKEIYGVITFQRVNRDANWLFVLED